MAWITPTTRSAGALITAVIWNQDIVNNPVYLKTFVDVVQAGGFFWFGGSTGEGRVDTTYPSGATLDKLAPNTGVLRVADMALVAATIKLFAVLKISNVLGTVSLSLVNLTDGAPDTPLTNGTITSQSATGAYVESGSITIPAGTNKDFGVKLKTDNASYSAFAWCVGLKKTA